MGASGTMNIFPAQVQKTTFSDDRRQKLGWLTYFGGSVMGGARDCFLRAANPAVRFSCCCAFHRSA